MDKSKRLKEIQSKLLGIELDLDLIEQDIQNIEGDINYLYLIEEETIYNITILKQAGVVADLKSYKQSWQKLAHIQSKIVELKSKRQILLKKMDQKMTSKEFYDKEWEQLHNEIQETKVILVFKKRKK